MLKDLEPMQYALALRMSDISETAYCATWLGNLEYDLWRSVVEDPPFEYGLMTLEEMYIQRLRVLSEACGGWIICDKQDYEMFVPLAEWERLY